MSDIDETTDATEATDFDPAKHLSTISGGRYLEVKFRIRFFREQHPLGSIVSEHIEITDKRAVFKATVSDAAGNILAVDYGSETPDDFRDHIEKASTKAIGRALSAAGFGTQFVDDHDFGADQGRVVDSPVGGQYVQRDRATEKQIRALYAIGRASGRNEAQIEQWTQDAFGRPPNDLSRREASQTIDAFKVGMASPADAGPAGSTPPEPRRSIANPTPTATSSVRRAPPPQVKTATGDIRPPTGDLYGAMQACTAALTTARTRGESWSQTDIDNVTDALWDVTGAKNLSPAQLGELTALFNGDLRFEVGPRGEALLVPNEPPADGLLNLDDLPFEAEYTQPEPVKP